MTHEKYTQLICLCICGIDVDVETQPLAKFKTGRPERCPSCGGNVWNHFNPPRTLHDIAAYENAMRFSRQN